ncbi:MAG: S4 domain-containing protein [Porphyromonas sp.]|nr:S4 domain-containing protein [Porphyromonas sp.]
MEVRVSRVLSEYYGYARREADELIQEGRVTLNSRPAKSGDLVSREDVVELDGVAIPLKGIFRTVSREQAQKRSAEQFGKAKHYEKQYEENYNPKSRALRKGRKNEWKKRTGKNTEWLDD